MVKKSTHGHMVDSKWADQQTAMAELHFYPQVQRYREAKEQRWQKRKWRPNKSRTGSHVALMPERILGLWAPKARRPSSSVSCLLLKRHLWCGRLSVGEGESGGSQSELPRTGARTLRPLSDVASPLLQNSKRLKLSRCSMQESKLCICLDFPWAVVVWKLNLDSGEKSSDLKGEY